MQVKSAKASLVFTVETYEDFRKNTSHHVFQQEQKRNKWNFSDLPSGQNPQGESDYKMQTFKDNQQNQPTKSQAPILLMAEIPNNHLGCINPCK